MTHPRILCLSNGHGEDQIACRIGAELLQLGAEVIALPIVGEGKAYDHLGISVLGATQVMPSGGFIYQDWRQLWRDLQGGLLGLTWRQLRLVRRHRCQVDLVLAVGDIVVLALAWLSGAPYGFVGTAKSDYYWRDLQGPYRPPLLPGWGQVSDYLPWERWLMGCGRCRGVFPRDPLTSRSLAELGLPVYDLGNPMMDGFQSHSPQIPLQDQLSPDRPALLVLPGSRPPEAYENWRRLMAVVHRLPADLDLQIYAAITGNLSVEQLQRLAGPRPVQIVQGQFEACAQRATVVLAMTGTGTEQCVGLGKPVVTIPGAGPQFTPRFAEAQTRLLGPSICYGDPEAAPQKILELLNRVQQDPQFREQLRVQGRQRMGEAGAGAKIARQVLQICQ